MVAKGREGEGCEKGHPLHSRGTPVRMRWGLMVDEGVPDLRKVTLVILLLLKIRS